MHLPGFRSNRSRPDAAPGRRHRNAGAARGGRRVPGSPDAMMDASSAGHPPRRSTRSAGPAVDAATLARPAHRRRGQRPAPRARRRRPPTTPSSPSWTATAASSASASRAGSPRRSPATPSKLVFAIDGALAKARTGAFFANNQAPLTSRTVQFISQTTITQREVESDPSITDPNSTVRGPGLRRPDRHQGPLPARRAYTPQVDLFDIEHTNRDSIRPPGADAASGARPTTSPLPEPLQHPDRVHPDDIPADRQPLAPPDSYGFVSGLAPDGPGPRHRHPAGRHPDLHKKRRQASSAASASSSPARPGTPTEENSSLNDANYDPTKPDRSLEAEYIAFAAVGGTTSRIHGRRAKSPGRHPRRRRPAGRARSPPFGRIDLVGITLDIFGPGGDQGPSKPASQVGQTPRASARRRANGTGPARRPADRTRHGDLASSRPAAGARRLAGHAARRRRHHGRRGAADHQPTGSPRPTARGPPSACRSTATARMVFAVGRPRRQHRRPVPHAGRDRLLDRRGRGQGAERRLLRRPDATPADRPGARRVPPGRRSPTGPFRYLALPLFPEGIDGYPPGPFSILNDGGVDPQTGLNVGPPLPASAFQSVLGYDAFNPQTNFHDPNNPPTRTASSSSPAARRCTRSSRHGDGLIGGFGVSGDGVDQDDVVTFVGATGFSRRPPSSGPTKCSSAASACRTRSSTATPKG